MKDLKISDIELTACFKNKNCYKIKKTRIFLDCDDNKKVLDITIAIPYSLRKVMDNENDFNL